MGSLRRIAWWVALSCLGLLAGCMASRPLQPSPPLYTLWQKSGVQEAGVREALLGCGFADSAYIDNRRMTPDDYARAELCMVDQGYRYLGRRIVCTDAPDLPACAQVPRGKTFGTDPDFDPARVSPRPPRPAESSRWARPGTDSEGVRQAMQVCGYTTTQEPVDVMPLNDIAAAQLCMLDQRFTYALPYQSLVCKSVPGLPACRNHRIDTRHCCAAPKAAGQR
ncbi:hypothetical protein [Achromobacter deleyi]|uniref:hypothetical protein n=1 Tax=Achromobacter deleyi TaxID=1353891 RepID=UPI0014679EE9|nr:hypothetical protein [Achromobacter deleyi]CAB3882350.1 hypothetical protein LMG3412_03323 [Achromobacter deleyi]